MMKKRNTVETKSYFYLLEGYVLSSNLEGLGAQKLL